MRLHLSVRQELANAQPCGCGSLVGMEHPTVVTRTVELDLTPDQAWPLIGDGGHWADWMVDGSDVDVEPGAIGTVTADDTERAVRIDEVVDGECVRFDWWDRDRPDAPSTVELAVVPNADGGVAIHIVETFPAPRRIDVAQARTAWDVRATCAWATSLAYAPA